MKKYTKISVFKHFMYVDIRLSLKKVILITFERVTPHVMVHFLSVQHGFGLFATRCHALS